MIATGKLTNAGVSRLTEKLEKLNKRAERLGMDKLTLRVVSTEQVKVTGPSGLDYTVTVNHVEVDGSAPRINGWEVVARIEFTEAGNLVHVAPGADCDVSHYRTVGSVCEHCNTQRQRNDCIVIRHESGETKIVGRNCLADYIRSDNAEALIAYAGWCSESLCADCDEDDDYRGGHVKPSETVETVLQAASICIRKLGWKSSSAAYETRTTSTRSDVIELLFPPYNRAAHDDWTKWIKKHELTVCDYDRDLAAKVLAWAKSVEPADSEYLRNLSIIAQLEVVGVDKFGYIASMIPAYNKACERETERKATAASKGTKVFTGSPKVRMRGVVAVCVGTNSFDGQFGVTTLVRFEQRISDTEYAVIVWFASGDKTEEFEKGTEYTFDATVKDHSDHATYGKQTVVNRITVK